ncbi:hypothetical protein DMENIID0001_062500 [Sergentomyia squamirostris]
MLDNHLVTPGSLNSAEDVDEAVHHVTTAIQSAAWAATPAPILPIGSQVVPVSVREKVKERRQLRRRWQTTRNPDDKAKFNRASKELKDILSNIRNTAVNKYLSDLTPTHATDDSLWKAARRVRRMEEPNPPIKNSTDSWARTDKEKADVFAQHMKEVFQPWPGPDLPQLSNCSASSINQESHRIEPFTKTEIVDVITDELHPKKAPGYDLITGKVLKNSTRKCVIILQLIFNAILLLGCFPQGWKVAHIVMILKPG